MVDHPRRRYIMLQASSGSFHVSIQSIIVNLILQHRVIASYRSLGLQLNTWARSLSLNYTLGSFLPKDKAGICNEA